MAVSITRMPREFRFKPPQGDEMVLDDIGPGFTPDQVRDHYSALYPSLVSATVTGPKVENDKMVFTFETKLGLKG